MSELAALKLALDIGLAATQMMATSRQIYDLLHDLQSSGRAMTDEDWAKIQAVADSAYAERDAARKAAGFI